MELTKKKFWEEFWKNIKLPQTVNYDFNNDRVIAATIKQFIPKTHFKRKMVEIGCAPGKWLVFFNKELGYLVEGYEYLELAAQKTRENLQLNNVNDHQFHIYAGDFTTVKITERFDVVLSLGFIEHFQNFQEILEKHLTILKDGGRLIIGIPNFHGVNYGIQKFLDRYLRNKILPNHNLTVMKRPTLQDFAQTHNIHLVFNNYIGGFEPALFNVSTVSPVCYVFLFRSWYAFYQFYLRK